MDKNGTALSKGGKIETRETERGKMWKKIAQQVLLPTEKCGPVACAVSKGLSSELYTESTHI